MTAEPARTSVIVTALGPDQHGLLAAVATNLDMIIVPGDISRDAIAGTSAFVARGGRIPAPPQSLIN